MGNFSYTYYMVYAHMYVNLTHTAFMVYAFIHANIYIYI